MKQQIITCKSGNVYHVRADWTGDVAPEGYNNNSLPDCYPIEDVLEIAAEYVKFQRCENSPAWAALGFKDDE